MTAIRHAIAGTVLRWTATALVALATVVDRPPKSRIEYIQETPE